MSAKTLPALSARRNTHADPAKPALALPVALGAILEGAGQLPLFDATPDPAGSYWRAFTLDTSEDDAAAAFLRRYGQPPRYIFENLGLLLVGPVPGLEGGV